MQTGGIRTSKTIGGQEHRYLLNGSQIVAEEFGIYCLVYLYDENGAPIGMQYRTQSMAVGEFQDYFFEKNLQGDIVAMEPLNNSPPNLPNIQSCIKR